MDCITQASLSFTISKSLLKLMFIKWCHLILCCLLHLLLSVFSSIRVFSNESAVCIMWPNYCSFNFSINPFNEYSKLISFRMDWFGVLAVQGILKSLLLHHSPKASILRCSAFFMVQLSHPYMTTGKTIALTIQTFIGKVISLHFNMLSRFIYIFKMIYRNFKKPKPTSWFWYIIMKWVMLGSFLFDNSRKG